MSEERIAALEARVAKLERTARPLLSEAALLADKFGNPVIRKDPKKWTGPSQVGKTYSEAPAVWLYMDASLQEWKADTNEREAAETGDQSKLEWVNKNREDAHRAKSWAHIIETRPAPVEPVAAPVSDDADGMPF